MVGTTISHYKVIEKIGEGGMGEVYRAEDTNLSREVVIKVLPEQFTQDPQRLARFEREAKLLASLDHPNIAAMYEFEETEGLGILSLEFVEGETLAERLTKGLLPIKETLEIADQIAQALEFVHEKGFIHNDLKPSNVMVTPEGKVKILDFGLADFGLAKVFEWETSTLRELGGTPAYASPEQLLGKLRDTRTDLFSLGVMLYEMATGSRPFTGKTLSALAAEIINNTPTSPARLNPDVPPELVSIINKALEKDPEIRYQRIGELLEDLNRLRLGVTTIDSKALQYTEFFFGSLEQEAVLPELLSSPGRWSSMLDSHFLALFYLTEKEQKRVAEYQKNGWHPFPALLAKKDSTPAALIKVVAEGSFFSKNKTANAIAFGVGPQASFAIQDHTHEVIDKSGREISYRVDLCFVIGLSEDRSWERIKTRLGKLLKRSLSVWEELYCDALL